MPSRLQVMVDDAVERMDLFHCECEAITEPHQKRDCSGVWQAVMRGEQVHPLMNAIEAQNRYPRDPFNVQADWDECHGEEN